MPENRTSGTSDKLFHYWVRNLTVDELHQLTLEETIDKIRSLTNNDVLQLCELEELEEWAFNADWVKDDQ